MPRSPTDRLSIAKWLLQEFLIESFNQARQRERRWQSTGIKCPGKDSLLFAAELLAGVIGGGGTSTPETHQLDTICNHMLTVVIDPAALVEPKWMEREIDTLIDYVTSSPPADPDEPVLVPGDPERLALEKRMAEGIPEDPVTWDGILEAGEQVDLPRTEAADLLANA